jgi:hypothetical protein
MPRVDDSTDSSEEEDTQPEDVVHDYLQNQPDHRSKPSRGMVKGLIKFGATAIKEKKEKAQAKAVQNHRESIKARLDWGKPQNSAMIESQTAKITPMQTVIDHVVLVKGDATTVDFTKAVKYCFDNIAPSNKGPAHCPPSWREKGDGGEIIIKQWMTKSSNVVSLSQGGPNHEGNFHHSAHPVI